MITVHPDRQGVIGAWVNFTFADFVSGTLQKAINLPGDAIVVDGVIVIDTAFNSVTSDTLTVGDVDVNDRYKGAINGQTAALTALVITGKAAVNDVGIRWTGVGTAPTAGAGRLYVEYIRTNRSEFTQD